VLPALRHELQDQIVFNTEVGHNPFDSSNSPRR
jgi:hypothetical protein